jgi:hypothetical protein
MEFLNDLIVLARSHTDPASAIIVAALGWLLLRSSGAVKDFLDKFFADWFKENISAAGVAVLVATMGVYDFRWPIVVVLLPLFFLFIMKFVSHGMLNRRVRGVSLEACVLSGAVAILALGYTGDWVWRFIRFHQFENDAAIALMLPPQVERILAIRVEDDESKRLSEAMHRILQDTFDGLPGIELLPNDKNNLDRSELESRLLIGLPGDVGRFSALDEYRNKTLLPINLEISDLLLPRDASHVRHKITVWEFNSKGRRLDQVWPSEKAPRLNLVAHMGDAIDTSRLAHVGASAIVSYLMEQQSYVKPTTEQQAGVWKRLGQTFKSFLVANNDILADDELVSDVRSDKRSCSDAECIAQLTERLTAAIPEPATSDPPAPNLQNIAKKAYAPVIKRGGNGR